MHDPPSSLLLVKSRKGLAQLLCFYCLCHQLHHHCMRWCVRATAFCNGSDNELAWRLESEAEYFTHASIVLLQENVIQIEYVERSPPPSLSKVFDHRDWVSCVHCSSKLWVHTTTCQAVSICAFSQWEHSWPFHIVHNRIPPSQGKQYACPIVYMVQDWYCTSTSFATQSK